MNTLAYLFLEFKNEWLILFCFFNGLILLNSIFIALHALHDFHQSLDSEEHTEEVHIWADKVFRAVGLDTVLRIPENKLKILKPGTPTMGYLPGGDVIVIPEKDFFSKTKSSFPGIAHEIGHAITYTKSFKKGALILQIARFFSVRVIMSAFIFLIATMAIDFSFGYTLIYYGLWLGAVSNLIVYVDEIAASVNGYGLLSLDSNFSKKDLRKTLISYLFANLTYLSQVIGYFVILYYWDFISETAQTIDILDQTLLPSGLIISLVTGVIAVIMAIKDFHGYYQFYQLKKAKKNSAIKDFIEKNKSKKAQKKLIWQSLFRKLPAGIFIGLLWFQTLDEPLFQLLLFLATFSIYSVLKFILELPGGLISLPFQVITLHSQNTKRRSAEIIIEVEWPDLNKKEVLDSAVKEQTSMRENIKKRATLELIEYAVMQSKGLVHYLPILAKLSILPIYFYWIFYLTINL